MSDTTIATTILQQLGGSRFKVMTGAKDIFSTGGNALSFKLPGRFARYGINYVKITLDPSDTYTMEFGKIYKIKGMPDYRVIETRHDIYCDQLQDVFKRVTGLDTHL